MENIKSFGYDQSDKKVKVEIYGLEFELNKIDEKDIEELQKIKETENQNSAENLKILDKLLVKILGKDSIKKINEKRKSDGYKEMDIMIKMQVLIFVFEIYMKEITASVTNMIEKTNNYMNNGYRRNNYKRKYRRY